MRGLHPASPLRLPFPGLLAAVVAVAIALVPDPEPLQAQDTALLVDSIFSEWDRPESPGCVVGVYLEGRPLLIRGYGEANLDWGIPIDERTVFYAGSVSKQFAAASAALLHLEGTLDLDSDVRRWIPELPAYDPPVTVRHLVHHTSGVRDIYGLISLSGGRTADAWTDREYLDLLARQTELNFVPGDAYLYSNGAYYLLTTLIERASGERLDDVARRLIFEPLGMSDTHFHQDRERIVPRRAMSYGGSADDGFRQTYLGNFDKAGAGGLYTTVHDLAAWDRNFVTGEVGGEAFLELVHTPGVLNGGDTLSYAFGLQLGEHEGHRTVGHGGSFMGFRADFVRFPDEGLSVAALCNLGGINPGPLTRRVAELHLPSIDREEPSEGDRGPEVKEPEEEPAAPLPPSPPGAPLGAFAGTYRSSEVGATFEIRWEEGELRLLRPGGAGVQTLRHQGADRFEAPGVTLEFELTDGHPASFRLDAGRVRNLLFTRLDREGEGASR